MAFSKKILIGFLFFAQICFASTELQILPVQDGGRQKPFDSFARENLELVYGKASFEGRQAYEVIFTWMLSPETWAEKEIFQVVDTEVKKKLGLDPKKKRFKGTELFDQSAFSDLMIELRDQR